MMINTTAYRQEVLLELEEILQYWMLHTIDQAQGGFYGQVDECNQANPDAPKGIVLNSRILWAFSAAFGCTGEGRYLEMAHRAYAYITDHFIDRVNGGVFWSVDAKGSCYNDRKQVYGQAFCLYGLSEYYQATREPGALELAINLFRLLERHAFDTVHQGYYEAYSADWHLLDDLRLSSKDANEKKSMNTHLHVIEAYACLYRTWPDPLLKQQIENLLQVFVQHIIDQSSGHLLLFFEEDWTPHSSIHSYGHDIEAAWLLQEAAEILGDERWIAVMKRQAIRITHAAMEGLDKDGGLWYERENGHLIREKHSWPQAEAMVGFLNAAQVSGDAVYLQHSLNSFRFVQRCLKDRVYGEWFWGVQENDVPMPGQDKAGFWKCPYHNSRACIEVSRRLEKLALHNTRQPE